MKNPFRKTLGLLGVLLMGSQLIAAPTTGNRPVQPASSAFEQAAPVTPTQKQIERLLKKLSSDALSVSHQADQLDAYTRNPKLHYSTHAAELNRVKESINTMGSDLRRLQELRASALPWQQQLIDRIQPVLVGLAGDANEAIDRLNADRRGLVSAEYRRAVQTLYNYSDHARDVLSVNLSYADAREKLNRLDAAPVEVEPVVDATRETTREVRSLDQRVQSALLKLPYYGVFDHLAYRIENGRVILSGDVTRPVLKEDAERAVRRIEGICAVSNNISVLPLSPNDDRIRLATYRAVYGHSVMAPYSLIPHPPIRIIVENGNVTLKGVVRAEMDRSIAYLQANSVHGAFSVTNDLIVDL